MKIVHLVPGSGGSFYCENCLRDTALVHALRAQGHDVVMVPLYLPFFTDKANPTEDMPVFFGGINCYLQQEFAFFRKTPRWLDRLFDASWLLKWAASKEGSTSAADLGPMTLSMLRGEAGHQQKELERLAAWLAGDERPDVVHISNALLLGLAGRIKQAVGARIVCSLQDEHTWIDAMGPPYAERCWEAMAEAGAAVDAFVAVSAWFAQEMQRRMRIPEDRMHVVHLGVEVEGVRPARPDPERPVIGYLSRLSEAQGIGRLVEAFIALKQRPGLEHVRLAATGGVTPADKAFVGQLVRKLRERGLEHDAVFVPDFSREARLEFLASLSVLSVPVEQGEAFGAFLLEAMACGVPVVQPHAGAFPEVIAATGGGLLYDPDDSHGLENALAQLLADPGQARALGERGRAAVHERFTMTVMAAALAALYQELRGGEAL